MHLGSLKFILALSLCSVLIAAPLPISVSADLSPTYIFFEEDVEQPTFEEWNVRWEKSDANPESSIDTWCRTMHEYYADGHSAYCARQGYNVHYYNSSGVRPMNYNILGMPAGTPQSELVQRYDTDMDAIMRRPVSGLSSYETITLSFWFYSDTGVSNARQPGTGALVGYDFLNVIYYTGTGGGQVKRVAWTDSLAQATAQTWLHISVNIPNTATWVGFEFVSGSTTPENGDAGDAFTAYGVRTDPEGSRGLREGVYLDEISCVGTDPIGSTTLDTSVEALPSYQTNRTFPVAFADNNPLVPLEWVNLYYRVNGTGSWSKFTTPDRPSGAFVTSPIMFHAQGDGAYEFFTQGKDANDVMEVKKDSADASTVVDTQAPLTTSIIVGNQREGGYNGAVSVELVSTDPTSGVDTTSFSLDGGEWTEYVNQVVVSSGGPHSLQFRSMDKAGNTEGARSIAFNITEGLPGVVFQNQGTEYKDGEATINFELSERAAISKLEYSLDGAPFKVLDLGSRSVSFHGLDLGEHSVAIRSTDLSGQTNVDVVNFTVGSSSLDLLDSVSGNPLMVVGLIGCVVAIVAGATYLVRRKRGG